MKLIIITSVPDSFLFFRGQIQFMKNCGFDVHGVASPGVKLEEMSKNEDIPMYGIELSRRINPLIDAGALIKLTKLLYNLKPAIVNASTAKGGLLGAIAARLAKVPVHVHIMRGLLFDSARGYRRRLFYWTDSLPCRLADRVIAVSHAIRQKAIVGGICPPEKIIVIGAGSSNGVDAELRFNPEILPQGMGQEIRETYQIPEEGQIIGYVGRIVRDKGIAELAEAWKVLREADLNAYLMLVGSEEPQDPVPPEILLNLKRDNRVRFTGAVRDPAPFYKAMNILVLPTYREGFPNTPLEGAAMELPVIASSVDGCVDAVVDGETGLLVPPKNVQALTEAINKLLRQPELRRRMGEKGRQRMLQEFKPQKIWQGVFEQYQELLKSKLDYNFSSGK